VRLPVGLVGLGRCFAALARRLGQENEGDWGRHGHEQGNQDLVHDRPGLCGRGGIAVLAFAVVVTWIYLHTDGSLLLPMLFHSSVNTSAVLFGRVSGDDLLVLWWLFAALWALAAGIVVLRYGPTLTRREAMIPTRLTP
jgi:hypothetical protein